MGNVVFKCCIFALTASCVVLLAWSRRDKYTRTEHEKFVTLIVDNVLLYCFVLVHCYVHYLVKNERSDCTTALQVKKLNMSYEVASYVDIAERGGDANIRNRVRDFREKLSMMKEVLDVVGVDRFLDGVNICTFVVTCLFVASTVYSLK